MGPQQTDTEVNKKIKKPVCRFLDFEFSLKCFFFVLKITLEFVILFSNL